MELEQRLAMAYSRSTPAGDLERLAADPNRAVRVAAGLNIMIPPAVRARLAADENPLVRLAIQASAALYDPDDAVD